MAGEKDDQLVPLDGDDQLVPRSFVADAELLLDEDKLIQALLLAQDLLGDIEESLIPAGKDRPELATPEGRAIAANIFNIARRIQRRAKGVLPELPFRPTFQVKPSPVAHDFVVKGKEKASIDAKQKVELIDNTSGILSTILQLRVDIGDPTIAAKIQAFSQKYASKDGLDVYRVITILSDPTSEFFVGVDRTSLESAFKDESVKGFIDDPKTSIFRSGVLPSKHFEQLLHGKVAALAMDIRKAWQSRYSGREIDEFLMELMGKAKDYISYTFNPGFLGEELSNCRSLSDVQRFAQLLPVDEMSFGYLKKAHLFLRVMHLMLLHDSEVDASSYVDNSDNLRLEMEDFCMQLPDGGCYINPPRDTNGNPKPNFEVDNYGMRVDRVEVAEGKPVYSAIDKVFRKDFYDMTDVGDFARMRIFLTKEDCYDADGSFNEEKTEKALEKLLGIIISRLGNDIDEKTLDYSVSTGKTNAASKGAHKGIHFNLKYKSSCNANGLTVSGEPVTKSIEVEVQILAYMEKESYEDDHKSYQDSRKKLLFQKLGFENAFDNFVLDLISAVSNDKYDFGFRSTVDPFSDLSAIDEEIRKVYERQIGIGDEDLFPESVDLESFMKEGWILFSEDKFRLFVLLLTILTKRDADGGLANARFLEYMQRYFPGRLYKLMEVYSSMLKGEQFRSGGEQSYLTRVIASRIQFVRNAISPERKGPMTGRKSAELFDVDHYLRVHNVGKNAKGNPGLTLVTSFAGGTRRAGYAMELPYAGPIGIVSVPGDDNKSVDFCWQMQNGKQTDSVYRIEQDEDDKNLIVCYLLSGAEKLPMWVMQVNYQDESELSGRVYPYTYQVAKHSETNKAFLAVKGIDSSTGKDVTVANITRLTPVTGLGARQARFVNFVKEAGSVWNRAKKRQITNGAHEINI